jgi:hypothetical protein
MTDQKLSPHFALSELLNSPTATIKGITEQFDPTPQVIDNLRNLCTFVAEPVRALVSAHLGKDTPIRISSGYRCPRLNSAIGGVFNSQHLTGEAFDSVADGLPIKEYYELVKASNIVFDEAIIEHDSEGHYWLHLSYAAKGEQRGLCFIGTKLDGGGTATVPDGYGAFKNQA